MALSSENATRANIRIEIKNDFTESMDEDVAEESGELSEGEVEDDDISEAKEKEGIQREVKNKIYFPRSVVPSRSEVSFWRFNIFIVSGNIKLQQN